MEPEEIEGLTWEGYVFAEWVRRRGDLLRRCGIMSDAGEITEGERKFVGLMRDAFEKNFAGEKFSVKTLDACFQHLQRVGLLPSPPKPQQPQPVRQPKYFIEGHPRGGVTFRRGPYPASEILARARRIAVGETSVQILDEQNRPVDPDTLAPTDQWGNPIPAQPHPQAVQPQQSQQVQSLQAEVEREYLSFYQRSRSDQIKRRSQVDKDFASWLKKSGATAFVQASSGGVDSEGNPVEPRRL